jgi:hypothetical protein
MEKKRILNFEWREITFSDETVGVYAPQPLVYGSAKECFSKKSKTTEIAQTTENDSSA